MPKSRPNSGRGDQLGRPRRDIPRQAPTRGSFRYEMPGAVLHLDPEAVLGRPLNEIEKRHVPREFYAIGDISLLRWKPKVSIVGSREASDEGGRRAAKLARILVQNQVLIVSGLAKGIDTAAHRATIEHRGHTIGVIGTPLDQTYPRENAELQMLIAREHLLMSQYEMGRRTLPRNFPMRNRTMALISDATVIVEAGNSSGSLSQGWEALRLGRALFIMASLIDVPGLDWPDQMLEYGAHILREPDDLLEALPFGEHLPAVSA